MIEEQRIPFPDYTPEEQKRDATKANRKHYHDVYVMRVNGDWGAILPRKRHNVIFNADKGVELTEFVKDVKEELTRLGIKTKFHCVRNFGIESKIAEHQGIVNEVYKMSKGTARE